MSIQLHMPHVKTQNCFQRKKMIRKSSSCFSKRHGKPLSVYASRWAAQQSADYENHHYGNDLVPYHCYRCGEWHLSPQDRQTPNTKCRHCRGFDGKHKNLYVSETYAGKRAAILKKEKGISLRTYKCPYNSGWHLTKG